METFRLGGTDLVISRTGFGALPIQRVSLDEAAALLRRAYEGGITFFDTARGYSDSEEKIGYALADVRDSIVIATKTPAKNRDGVWRDLETSLAKLRTDYIDLLQLHTPAELPDAEDPDSSYAALVEARDQGLIRHIGLSNHRLEVAKRAVESGHYATLQYPLSALSDAQDLALIELCREHDVGVIAMKGLCGGLLTDAAAAFAFLRRFENLVPIWGVQRLDELEEFLALDADPPPLDAAMRERLEDLRAELAGDYCRACGYCLPCPAEIPIPMAARMSFLLRRARTEGFLTKEWRERMHRIENCEDCGECRERCPYGLDPPVLLKKMLIDYDEVYARGYV